MNHRRLARAASHWERFWFQPGPSRRLALFRILLLALAFNTAFRYAPGVFQSAVDPSMSWAQRPWKPILLIEILGWSRPSLAFAQALFAATLIAIGLAMLGLWARMSSLLAAALFTLWVAVAYSLGKPHHDCVALTLGLWSLCLGPVGAQYSLDRWLALHRAGEPAAPNRAGEPAETGAWIPLRFTQLTIVIGYVAAGWSKLLLGSTDWLNGYSLQRHILSFHGPWGPLLAQNVEVLQVSATVTVVIQATFFLVFIGPLRWIYLPLGVAFHIVSWKTMETGPYHSLWMTYAVFLPLERIWDRTRPLWRQGPVGKRLQVGLVAALAGMAAAGLFASTMSALGEASLLTLCVLAVALVWRLDAHDAKRSSQSL